MRKQTKLVAVLSAAALLAMGAFMTSFAAGWEKDDAGVWHYYDRDDDMVTDEWKKDGGKWFYLDDDGDMLMDAWVDDEYYVGDDGAMLINQWKKTLADEDVNDPDEEGEHWYYFGSKGKKTVDTLKKINGKTYYFDEDGEMEYGWYTKNNDVFYLGDEDDGARVENAWRWLTNPSQEDEDHDAAAAFLGCTDSSGDGCDEEGWYWFGTGGKMAKDADKKKVNGKYYYFNKHGQMLYEWINDQKVSGVAPATPTNAKLDGSIPAASAGSAYIDSMIYTNEVEDGSRVDGWYQIDGSKDTGKDTDTDWYFFKDGKAKKASRTATDYRVNNNDGPVYVARIKVISPKGGKEYFAFNEYGQMQTGLQYIPAERGFYYFDGNGYPVTGKVTNVECDDDTYEFYFNKNNGANAKGLNGEKSGYLYFNGKKLVADDDYRLYYYNGDVYLVNTKGKIQKTNRKYDIENSGIEHDKVDVTFRNNGTVKDISYENGSGTITLNDVALIYNTLLETSNGSSFNCDAEGKYSEKYVNIPYIQLYDDDVYTYDFRNVTVSNNTLNLSGVSEKWFDVNVSNTGTWR